MRKTTFLIVFLLTSLWLFAEEGGISWRDLCKNATKGNISEREAAVRQLRFFLGEREVMRTYSDVLKTEREFSILLAAIEAIRTKEATSLFNSVLPYIWHSHLDIRRNATLTLAAMDRDKAVKTMLSSSRKGNDDSVEAIRALGRILYDGEGELITPLLKLKHEESRAVAIAALMRMGCFQEALKVLPLLGDSSRVVREQAINACGFFRIKDSFFKLIAMLKDKDYAEHALATLKELSGRPFAPDAKIWTDWWGEIGSTIDMPPFETLGNDGPVTMFEHTVRARRFVFLLDYSDSMGSGTGSSLEGQLNEVKRCIIPLYPNVEFNCVTYSKSAERFVLSAVECDSVAKKDFLVWLRTQGTGEYTSTFDGFKFVFEIPEVNIVFFSGNGVPNWGDLPAGKNSEIEDNVLQAVRDIIKKKNLNLSIYSIAFPFGKDAYEDGPEHLFGKDKTVFERTYNKRCESFFRLMAALNGGKYCYVPISQKKIK